MRVDRREPRGTAGEARRRQDACTHPAQVPIALASFKEVAPVPTDKLARLLLSLLAVAAAWALTTGTLPTAATVVLIAGLMARLA